MAAKVNIQWLDGVGTMFLRIRTLVGYKYRETLGWRAQETCFLVMKTSRVTFHVIFLTHPII